MAALRLRKAWSAACDQVNAFSFSKSVSGAAI